MTGDVFRGCLSVTSVFDLQEKMTAIEAQAKQLALQAAQDCERMAKDRTMTLQQLHKVSLSLVSKKNLNLVPFCGWFRGLLVTLQRRQRFYDNAV